MNSTCQQNEKYKDHSYTDISGKNTGLAMTILAGINVLVII
jgi:hypothetical protein